MATLGGASTYAIGRVFKQHFEKGGTLEDFDPKKVADALETEQKKARSPQQNKKPSARKKSSRATDG